MEQANCAEMHLIPFKVTRGRNASSFVVRELVYTYATRNSPVLNLLFYQILGVNL